MKKRLFYILMMFAIVFVISGKQTQAETYGDYEYKILEDGTAELTAYTGNATTLTLPDTINGYKVSGIGSYLFGENAFHPFLSNITVEELTIPEGVAYIDKFAIYYCSPLKKVVLPDSLERIDDYAFLGCENLESITISENVKIIGKNPFIGCSKIQAFAVNENNTNFCTYDGVLYDKMKTRLIACPYSKSGEINSIPNTVKTIGVSAFQAHNDITAVTIPESVETIEKDAFYCCENLSSVSIQGAVSIEEDAFAECYELETVTLPETLKTIGDGAFRECYDLANINLPKNMTSIGTKAFTECGDVTNFDIPAGVNVIGDSAFADCYSLLNINVDGNNQYYSSKDGILYNKNKTVLITCPKGKSGVIDGIPETVKELSNEAFLNCAKITDVKLPSSLTVIGENAFKDCTGLVKFRIPENVNKIETGAFQLCTYLEEVTLPETLTDLGDYAFYSCYKLKKISIPKNVERIGEYAFCVCSDLSDVTIAEGVKGIGDYAFFSCDKLTEIEIPKSVTNIDDCAIGSPLIKPNLQKIVIKNPTCMIFDGKDTISSSATVFGVENSTAQDYARKYNRTFAVYVENDSENQTPDNSLNNNTTTQTSASTQTPASNDKVIQMEMQIGKIFVDSSSKASYTVTSTNGTVAYKGTTDKKAKSVSIPATVTSGGVTYYNGLIN